MRFNNNLLKFYKEFLVKKINFDGLKKSSLLKGFFSFLKLFMTIFV